MRLTRITLFIIALIIFAGFNLLVRKQLADVEPQLFQATEETMVDAAYILAACAEQGFVNDGFDETFLRTAMDTTQGKSLNALIYNHTKKNVGIDVYVTDDKGIILFDSGYPERKGQNFYEKNDVFRTLQGRYGARSSKVVEIDKSQSVMHVAAPIGDPKQPIGVLTVYKAKADVLPIVRRRISEIWWGTGLVGGGILFCVGVVFVWQYRPISKLTEYARDIEQGKRRPLPRLGIGKEVKTLAHALESMRKSLEGRQFAERYVQTLTHEMKSPLAAIRGAAELLNEDGVMPEEDRRRFIGNISAEALRAERLLAKLMELSVIEGKSALDVSEVIDLRLLVERVVTESLAMADLAGIVIDFQKPPTPAMVMGDPFILRAAMMSLLENAVDFSPRGESVTIGIEMAGDHHRIVIADKGDGIPEFAREKVFDRFFSLRHMRSGRKGTGLGLTLVREAAILHNGSVVLETNEPHGTRAVLSIPAC